MKVYGYNSVAEALKAGKVNKIYVAENAPPKCLRLVAKAREKGIPVYKLSELPEKIAADVSPISYADLEEIISKALEGSFILVLDNVMDQRNLGACIRTAEFFGAAGVLIPKRRAAQVEEGALRTSAGAAFHVPIAREENLASALKKIKKFGIFVIALDLDGRDIDEVDMSPPLALVVGGEDRGISHPVKKMCDEVVRIPGFGKVGSLNLAVAAGIAMFEVAKKIKAGSAKAAHEDRKG
ncbi:MAG: 23S rRNA (guanosine(2251)-2'-O)-methyltransferase RlmB [Archaeoglobaceae archaeon]